MDENMLYAMLHGMFKEILYWIIPYYSWALFLITCINVYSYISFFNYVYKKKEKKSRILKYIVYSALIIFPILLWLFVYFTGVRNTIKSFVLTNFGTPEWVSELFIVIFCIFICVLIGLNILTSIYKEQHDDLIKEQEKINKGFLDKQSEESTSPISEE